MANGINRQSTALSSVFRGSSECLKVYRATSLVWEKKLAVEFLAIAGGGSGLNGIGTFGGFGGGAAGDYIESTLDIPLSAQTITIGAGASPSTSPGGNTTIGSLLTALGGQSSQLYGSFYTHGGNNSFYNGGIGGDQSGADTRSGGAGGAGAGASATDSVTQYGSAGATGRSSSINGTATTRGGGGGGGRYDYANQNAGGAGGGGTGACYAQAKTSTSGSVNTGSGGGGGSRSYTGGSGGSGLVIIRYPGSVAKATGGTITYISGYVVHTFTTSGTFTPFAA